MIAISADDDVHCLLMENETRGLIELYRDPDANEIIALGLEDRDDAVEHLIARPTAIVVDHHGVVRYRYVGRSEDDRPKVALLLLAAESLGLDTRPDCP